MLLLIPTAEMVKEISPIKDDVSFLEGDVRDIVRECVLSYVDPTYGHVQSILEPRGKVVSRSAASDYVLRLYENAVDGCDITVEEYLNNVGRLEFMIESIERQIHAMLDELFQGNNPTATNKEVFWIGDDVAVDCEIRKRNIRCRPSTL